MTIVIDTNILVSALMFPKGNDDKFIACALESGTNLIISGDQPLLKLKSCQGVSIIAAKEFLETKDFKFWT